jgi:hypothetical protein
MVSNASQKPSFVIQLASTAKVIDFEVQIVPKVVSISMMQKGCSFSDFATWHWLRSRLDQDDYSGWR